MTTNINETKPVHGTMEWATNNVNIQQGCEHGCLYCFAQGIAIRFKRSTPTSWLLPSIREDAVQRNYRKRHGRVMFPTTHDITQRNLSCCLTVLRKLLEAGNDVLIVSKPSPVCVMSLCEYLNQYKDHILFRFTIGSTDESTLSFWEPKAPSFENRLMALTVAYRLGFQTSVSAEPMLDVRIARLIEAVRPYVTDAVWLGRANRLRQLIAINCPDNSEAWRRTDLLTAQQTDDYLRDIYRRYKDDPLIKFKDSIKQAAGLTRPTEKGLDI